MLLGAAVGSFTGANVVAGTTTTRVRQEPRRPYRSVTVRRMLRSPVWRNDREPLLALTNGSPSGSYEPPSMLNVLLTGATTVFLHRATGGSFTMTDVE